MRKVRKYIVILIGVVVLTISSHAGPEFVQDPNDQQVADTVAIEFSKLPHAASGQMEVQLDLYVFHDVNELRGAGMGFAWDNPNMVMDSAVVSPLAASGFDLGQWLYVRADIDSANHYRWFSFGGFMLTFPGIPPASTRQLWASYYFTMTDWSENDQIVVDSFTYITGTKLMLVGDPIATWVPYFAGSITGVDTEPGCCFGTRVGNVDYDPLDQVDIADQSLLIDHLFINFPPLVCPDEADLDYSGNIDIADLTILIDHLFVTLEPLGACP